MRHKKTNIYDSTYTGYLEQSNPQTKGRMVVARGWRKGKYEDKLFNNTNFSLRKCKRSRDGQHNNVFNATEL